MSGPNRTVLYDCHVRAEAKIVEFAGWCMPLHYGGGIVAEHLATRKRAGLFDVSHMGRFIFRGPGAVALLQHCLTNNAAALAPGQAQYTIIANATGGAIDDAYLYREAEDEYLLVVNAAGRAKDWDHLRRFAQDFGDVRIQDATSARAMLALQGPRSRQILEGAMDCGALPAPRRNELATVRIGGADVLTATTGYTGEPLCLELFMESPEAPRIWDLLTAGGATPVGLGARDTLRLEASLPLFGHELGTDPQGRQIPIFACAAARSAVSFSQDKGDFIGRDPLIRQRAAYERISGGDTSQVDDLPRMIRPVALLGRGVGRRGDEVFSGCQTIGCLTSGTMVPYWKSADAAVPPGDAKAMRALALALLDSRVSCAERISVRVRGKLLPAVVVRRHLRSDDPPYAQPVVRTNSTADQANQAMQTPGELI